jgi:hypothetical protein
VWTLLMRLSRLVRAAILLVRPILQRSGSVGIHRVDDQLECTTVAQADRREVTYVSRGQAPDAETLGERDDRSNPQAQGQGLSTADRCP